MKKILYIFTTLLCAAAQGTWAQTDVMTWDFEDEAQLSDWTFVDKDGDGHNWMYFSNAERTYNLMTTHTGDGLVTSESYDAGFNKPLSPDNWLISPQLILGGVLSLWACGQDSDFFTENFAVYVCIDGLTDGEGSIQVGDYHFLQVGTDITATKEMTEYEFGLSQFQGQTGRFAIRHYNSADKYMLNIDDVKLDLMMQTYPTLPEDLTVTPSSTTAHVTWTDTDDEVWNLRYRIFTPSLKESYSWDFESEESRAEWTSIDKDGDGNNWFPSDAHGNPHGGQYSMESDSYDYPSSRELNPDNWLISPKVTLGGTLSLWANSWQEIIPTTSPYTC